MIRLEAGEYQRSHGHVKAVVRATDENGQILFADTLRLSSADDRRAYTRELSELAPDAVTDRAEMERQLLTLYELAADELERQPEHPPHQRPKNQATLLVDLASDAELFHDPNGEAYATIPVIEHRETWLLRQRGFKDWLARRFFEQHGGAPSSQALADAIGVLRGNALFEGPERPVYVRVAELGGRTYIDLGTDAWEAIEVSPAGWRVIADPPVRFRRARGMLPLPYPVGGGALDLLRPFVNVASDDDWRLLLSWLLAALRATGPYAVLILYGEQGSAKSTVLRVLRALLDPNQAALRSAPRDERDLAIAAHNGRLLIFDNLSSLPGWLSDALCRVSTGGGFATRELYTDVDEILIDVMRPIATNSIEELATRGDLADRALALSLPSVARRLDERQFWADFGAARPMILGAVLDAMVTALKNEPDIHVERPPRMADFARWAVAAAPALGWDGQDFLRAYRANRSEASDLVLESSPIVEPLRMLADEGDWEGTATALLKALSDQADVDAHKQRGWPKDAARLSGILRRLATDLRAGGIDVQFERCSASSRRRTIRIVKLQSRPPDNGPHARDDLDRDHQLSGADDVGRPEQARRAPSEASEPSRRSEDGLRAPETSANGQREGSDTPALASVQPVRVRMDAADAADALFAHDSERVLMSDLGALKDVMPTLLNAPRVGLDTETTGLNPRSHRLRLVQLAVPGTVYLLDCFRLDPRHLAPLFDGGRTLVGHNLKFDLQFLAAAGLPIPSGECLLDTMVAAQLLGAGSGDGVLRSCGLAAVSKRYLGATLDKTERSADWLGDLSEAMLAYAVTDAAILLPLAERLGRALEEAGLEQVAKLEMRVLPALAWLEQVGAPFDAERWRALSDAALAEQIRLEHELTVCVKGLGLFDADTVNWASPAQVLRVLRHRGHQVNHTDEATLRTLAESDPNVELLLRYREASRRAGAYGIEFLKHVDSVTGRIHPDYVQLGAATGRMSCVRPNLQTIPRNPAYRACFRPPQGRVLVKADYSQIELRIAAEITGDQRMLEAYRRGEDLHAVTAAAVLGSPDGAVRPGDRQAAKALNFGLLYGMGAERLREHAANNYGVSLTEQEAERFRRRFFETYRGLRSWHRRQRAGEVETRTLAGRRRLGVTSFTEKLNSPIQGTGADGLKTALALLWETRDRCPSAVPVLVVHDEIVVECDADQVEVARESLRDCMVRGMEAFLHKVPIVVDVTSARDWSGQSVERVSDWV